MQTPVGRGSRQRPVRGTQQRRAGLLAKILHEGCRRAHTHVVRGRLKGDTRCRTWSASGLRDVCPHDREANCEKKRVSKMSIGLFEGLPCSNSRRHLFSIIQRHNEREYTFALATFNQSCENKTDTRRPAGNRRGHASTRVRQENKQGDESLVVITACVLCCTRVRGMKHITAVRE